MSVYFEERRTNWTHPKDGWQYKTNKNSRPWLFRTAMNNLAKSLMDGISKVGF